ncbi:hypothetical protein [Nakamurella endophytica]|uniref:Uncharacterized protein n=1 Tax=Nakamurella endophytica TaxID=1748367 RepID=A0A917TCR9_9ACTN|nr:hypothetical protein [Nakamurella endophytica]GGM18149.1 hypothetical protein GCM10011594_42780 [Nakamurella endophytica]
MTAPDGHTGAAAGAGRPPSLVPTAALLVGALVLIVVVLVNPDMPGWLRTTIAVLALVMVVALLVLSFRLFRSTVRRGGRS